MSRRRSFNHTAQGDSMDITLAQKTERSHQENQERAYIAASRRSDRSLEARVQSARMASEIHKKRTGKAFRITDDIVINEEMYEEEEEKPEARMARLMATQHQNNDTYSNSSNVNNNTTTANNGAAAPPAHANEPWHQSDIHRQFAEVFPNVGQHPPPSFANMGTPLGTPLGTQFYAPPQGTPMPPASHVWQQPQPPPPPQQQYYLPQLYQQWQPYQPYQPYPQYQLPPQPPLPPQQTQPQPQPQSQPQPQPPKGFRPANVIYKPPEDYVPEQETPASDEPSHYVEPDTEIEVVKINEKGERETKRYGLAFFPNPEVGKRAKEKARAQAKARSAAKAATKASAASTPGLESTPMSKEASAQSSTTPASTPARRRSSAGVRKATKTPAGNKGQTPTDSVTAVLDYLKKKCADKALAMIRTPSSLSMEQTPGSFSMARTVSSVSAEQTPSPLVLGQTPGSAATGQTPSSVTTGHCSSSLSVEQTPNSSVAEEQLPGCFPTELLQSPSFIEDILPMDPIFPMQNFQDSFVDNDLQSSVAMKQTASSGSTRSKRTPPPELSLSPSSFEEDPLWPTTPDEQDTHGFMSW